MRVIKKSMEVCFTREEIMAVIERHMNNYMRDTFHKQVDRFCVNSITIHKDAKYLLRVELSHDKKTEGTEV